MRAEQRRLKRLASLAASLHCDHAVPKKIQGGGLKGSELEPELEPIHTQMTEKPMLWAEVHGRALRASQKKKNA